MKYKYVFKTYLFIAFISTTPLHANGKDEVVDNTEDDGVSVPVVKIEAIPIPKFGTLKSPSPLDALPQPILGKIRGYLEEKGDLSKFAVISKAAHRAVRCARYQQMIERGFIKISDKSQFPILADMLSDNEAPEDFKSLEVRISDLAITDDDLKYLTNARSLDIRECTGITDAGLANISNATSVNLMSMRKNITNAGLAHLTNATTVILCFCDNITDEGLAHLTNATILDIKGCTRITDAGLAHLTKARAVNLGLCNNITDEGLAHLTNALTIHLVFCDNITEKAKQALRDRGVLVNDKF